MATYLGTHGSRIQNYTTDPDNPNNGEVWYNATANTLKFQFLSSLGAWGTSGSLNNARSGLSAAKNGTNTAGLVFGAYSPGPGARSKTESYNGTNWTNVNDLTNGRGIAGSAGTQTAALCISGAYPVAGGNLDATVEKWNGSNWTEVNDVNQQRYSGRS